MLLIRQPSRTQDIVHLKAHPAREEDGHLGGDVCPTPECDCYPKHLESKTYTYSPWVAAARPNVSNRKNHVQDRHIGVPRVPHDTEGMCRECLRNASPPAQLFDSPAGFAAHAKKRRYDGFGKIDAWFGLPFRQDRPIDPHPLLCF